MKTITDKLVIEEEFVSKEHRITNPLCRTRLMDSITRAKGNSGLPQFAGEWTWISEIAGWRVYIVHDPCHDDGHHHVEDRNTVIALFHRGSWRILGRELPMNLAKKIARGNAHG